ncbi:MAG: DUF3047 domain-containing protein [Thermodesulfobacteriota bacterium]
MSATSIVAEARILVLLAWFFFGLLPVEAVIGQETRPPLFAGLFSSGSLDGWEEKEFSSKSTYQLKVMDGSTVLGAIAENGASGLFKKQTVDLRQYPFLNWQWRVEEGHPLLAETTKKGDDYAARVYVIVDGGLFFWKTIAINYVWSSSQKKGSRWPNAFAGENAMLLAVRSDVDGDQTMKWYREKRNLRRDFKELFDLDVETIDGVAIMTDSDNSGGRVTAYYGDIFFTAQ